VLVYSTNRTLWTTAARSTTTINATAYDGFIWGTATTTYTPSKTSGYTAYRMFWVNKGGRIYSWSWRGL